MVITDIAFSIVIALVLSFIFIAAFRTRGPWGSIVLFFLLIFLAAWAGSVWIQPVGPVLWGVAWVPMLVLALLMGLLLAAVTHRGVKESLKSKSIAEDPDPEHVVTAVAIGTFFWLLILGILLVIIIGYFVVSV